MISLFLAAAATLSFADDPTASTEQKPAVIPAVQLNEVEAQIVKFTNSERARYGLPPLEVDPGLMRTARSHTVWMTNSRSLSHTRLPVAENIAMGQTNTWEAVRSWMGSSGHRANILSRGHRRIGVAGYMASNGQCYWCQQFQP